MWRHKKLILIGVLATVLVAGACIGGVALAQDSENNSQSTANISTLWDKVTAILQNKGVNITSEQLKDAFTQAQKDMQSEALQNYLQNLVKQGKINQEQADQYFKWWQAKPDVRIGFGFRGPGRLPGMRGFRGWAKPSPPTPSTPSTQ
jgi:hypothetical protein